MMEQEHERNLQAGAQPPQPAPLSYYHSLSVDEILLRCVHGGAAFRANVLAYERANDKRGSIIHPLVNWNS